MGVRAGQGFGVPKPKRLTCPSCQKKGVTRWKAGPAGLFRDCQYCCRAWSQASWLVETGQLTGAELVAALRK